MLFKFTALAASLCLLPSVLAARQTPNFYLAATTTDASSHLGIVSNNGGAANLITGTPVKLYLDGGNLRIDSGNGPAYDGYSSISATLGASGCSAGGALLLSVGGGSNKCSRSTSFTLQSYNLNSQLGAKLVFTAETPVTGPTNFYVCAGGALHASDAALSGCTFAELWTIPATV